MYLGRIVAVGQNLHGNNFGMYRISSQSFPNRSTKLSGQYAISVMPRTGFESDLTKNPYISYNCIRIAGSYAVICNGSHSDLIAEKIEMGYPVRDALALTLLAMDYEKDSYKTPRIAGVVNLSSNLAFLASVKENSLVIRDFNLTPGTLFYVATYEHSIPCLHYKDTDFNISSAEDAKNYIMNSGIFSQMELPVTSAGVFSTESSFALSSEI